MSTLTIFEEQGITLKVFSHLNCVLLKKKNPVYRLNNKKKIYDNFHQFCPVTLKFKDQEWICMLLQEFDMLRAFSRTSTFQSGCK